MHLARLLHLAPQPLGGDLAIDGDGHISTNPVVSGIYDALAKARILRFQGVDDLSYRGARHFYLYNSCCQFLAPGRRYPDQGHGQQANGTARRIGGEPGTLQVRSLPWRI